MTKFAMTDYEIKEGVGRCNWSRMAESIYFHHAVGFMVRMVLILYGCYQDASSPLPYTDVDYHVATDAARHVWKGGSPFDRQTYRYTPLLAWLMLPNVIWHEVIGKIVFSVLDLTAAHCIYKIAKLKVSSLIGEIDAVKCALLWLYNPLVIGISTRGSNESLVLAFVLAVLYFHTKRNIILTGILLGAAIHIKIYPIIYCLPLYLSIENTHSSILDSFFNITKNRILFVCTVVGSFTVLTYICYYLYGFAYIRESFLYHISRSDTRHNFSVHFYLMYLSAGIPINGLRLIILAPQFLVVFACGLVIGRERRHTVLAMFTQTFAFVTFNKVVTSQYFLWYLIFLPLIVSDMHAMSGRRKVMLPFLWTLGQLSWLFPAYLFEFKGYDAFMPMWLESMAFFSCNVGILLSITSHYWKGVASKELKCS